MADRWWIGAVNSDWATIGNWSATEGGASSGDIPAAGDDIKFSDTSGNVACTLDSSRIMLSIAFEAAHSGGTDDYTNTFNDGGFTLTVNGDIILSSGMTLITTGTWIANDNGDIENPRFPSQPFNSLEIAKSGKTSRTTANVYTKNLNIGPGTSTQAGGNMRMVISNNDFLTIDENASVLGLIQIFLGVAGDYTQKRLPTTGGPYGGGGGLDFSLPTGDKITATGDWLVGAGPFAVRSGIIDMNGNDLTCGIFRIGNAALDSIFRAGEGTINCTDMQENIAITTGSADFQAESATIINSGSADFTEFTYTKGTEIYRFTSTSAGETLITAGNAMGTVEMAMTGVGALTLQDALTCDNYTNTSGSFTDNGQTITVLLNLLINGGTIVSTGIWDCTGTGNLANPTEANAFADLRIAAPTKTTTTTGDVTANKLTIGSGALSALHAFYIYVEGDDFLSMDPAHTTSGRRNLIITGDGGNYNQKGSTMSVPLIFNNSYEFRILMGAGKLTITDAWNSPNISTFETTGELDFNDQNITLLDLRCGKSTGTNVIRLGNGIINLQSIVRGAPLTGIATVHGEDATVTLEEIDLRGLTWVKGTEDIKISDTANTDFYLNGQTINNFEIDTTLNATLKDTGGIVNDFTITNGTFIDGGFALAFTGDFLAGAGVTLTLTGLLTASGGNAQSITMNGKPLNNVSISKSALTATLQDALDCADFTGVSGNFNDNGQDMNIADDCDISGIIATLTGKIIMDGGAGDQDMTTGSNTLNDFEVDKLVGNLIHKDDMNCRNYDMTDGGVNVSGFIISLTGNLVNVGHSTFPNGTWKFIGAGLQTHNSNSNFINDVIIDKPAGTFRTLGPVFYGSFQHTRGVLDHNGQDMHTGFTYVLQATGTILAAGLAGVTLTVDTNYTVVGNAGNILTLNPAAGWTLNVGGWGMASYCRVKNSDASGGATIQAGTGTNIDEGANLNWDFVLAGMRILSNTGLVLGLGLF